MAALNGDGVDFIVLDHDINAFARLVAAAFIRRFDRLARFFIDELLPNPISGDFIDLPKGNALAR
jgi:hypothetical protein